MMIRRFPIVLWLIAATGVLLSAQASAPQEPQSFKFRTGVELINVNATVTDQSGRFVSGLNKDDFRVFEDEQPQKVSHFSAERVPVSLGIVLDTSGSMDGDKMVACAVSSRAAARRSTTPSPMPCTLRSRDATRRRPS
jgi:hypothetical protein